MVAGLVGGGLLAFYLTDSSPGDAPEGMVWVPGGEFWMGTDQNVRDSAHARPRHKVRVGGFWMDKTEVTNAEFARFVKATGYKTIAERKPKREDFAEEIRDQIPDEDLVPFSAVFAPPEKEVEPLDGKPATHLQWWKKVPGADWRHPEGPDSSIDGRMNHPVVQIAWEDAVAYAKWAGKRLPTEAEWEFAARGGLEDKEFPWGDEMPGEGGKWRANIWQGEFPKENTAQDGYRTTAPVDAFPANAYGLLGMSGNVWEWCADWYQPDYYGYSPEGNPQGPSSGREMAVGEGPRKVQRGGSFMCCDDYCRNYRTWTRHSSPPDSAANHIGFRCVKDR